MNVAMTRPEAASHSRALLSSDAVSHRSLNAASSSVPWITSGPGDTLVVTKVDRLARSTVGLWEIVKRLETVEDGGVGLRVLNLGGETVDTKSATGKLILTIFAGFAQFEREMMLERQREGIAKAKAENRYMGRRPSARLKADEAVKLFNAGRSVTDVATALNIGRGSVYRALEAAGMKSASGWT
jgi:DNA invertase Pin-like site-specific DNA recombinase